jgi:hypothetical protein
MGLRAAGAETQLFSPMRAEWLSFVSIAIFFALRAVVMRFVRPLQLWCCQKLLIAFSGRQRQLLPLFCSFCCVRACMCVLVRVPL